MEITMKDINQIIRDAAHTAVYGNERRHKYLTDYAKGIPTEAEEALKEAYLMRHKDYSDPEWPKLYAKFMVAMGDRWDKEMGIDKFKALAFTTKGMARKLEASDIIRKQAQEKIEEFTHGINR